MYTQLFCTKCESTPLMLDIELSDKDTARCICPECGYTVYICSNKLPDEKCRQALKNIKTWNELLDEE